MKLMINTFYDLTYFLKPAEESEIVTETEKIKSEIKKINGAIIEESLPEKRILSYPISKYQEGMFGSIKFTAEPESVNLLNSNLKKNTGIIRLMIKKELFRETSSAYQKRPAAISRQNKVMPKQSKKEITEIDKKLEEILQIKN